jgi:MOSC domain-containing protein YiiM
VIEDEMGQIVSIVYKPADDEAGVGDFVRVPIGDATLVAGHGIEGDLKGGVPGRHLNILAAESVAALAAQGFNGAPGAFGEQIVVSGVDVDRLGSGDQLRLGDTALVKVDRSRTGCAKFERNQGKSREQATGKLGIMAEVVEGGTIRVGDSAVVEKNA